MQNSNTRRILAAGLGLAALSWAARAHEMWLVPEGETLVLHYGHRASSHEGPRDLDYAPEIVLEVAAFSENGEPLTVAVSRDYPLRIPASCAAACVWTSSGYWTKTPYETVNRPRSETRQAIRCWQSFEGVKYLARWCPRFARSLSMHFEIVPLHDPTACRPGDKLELQIVFDGSPVANVIVAYAGKPRGETGDDGRINIRLRDPGFQSIQASWTASDSSGIGDEVVRVATFNFFLGE